ncbi:hypothetical protein F6R98_10535 [Candidatus Methylospira mobilis]|uniref:Capsid protein n=1 Tax=Candidatus Methylospira mobilis TaxID=1808979 RepID=A0A5Q0BLK2_9GAMM|nr:hypothetical protein [Candidatus Methylospira mobilis]QFY42998.1 hypothetical protein F6R98_10535 [Candidatus Methylospira mobilis]
MPNKIKHQYSRKSTAEVDAFTQGLRENAFNQQGTFDSAATYDFLSNVTNQNTGIKVPDNLQAVYDEVGEKGSDVVTRAILDGINNYETAHGCSVPADILEQAIHAAYGTTNEARRINQLPALDSANSNHMDELSLQPNRAVVAILSIMAEAIPFAHYLPADIGSNEARLAIMQHQAGSTYGGYLENAILDGIASGEVFITSSRIHKLDINSQGAATAKLTTIQTDDEHCDQSDTAVAPKLLRGTTIVYVNGKVAAREVDNTGSGNSPISGTAIVAGTSYAISGTINSDTGVVTLATTPAIPNTSDVSVIVEGFIDYERSPELTPRIITAVNIFKLHASPWRVFTQQTIDSRTQMSNELGLDPYGESVIGIQQQFANERHYKVLAMARRLAVNNHTQFDFNWATNNGGESLQKTRSQILQDFATPLGVADQQMANDTMNHGITHLYVGKFMASMLLSMPSDIFVPSGLPARPGIYRVGRLFGRFDVYYAPKGVKEAIVNGTQTAQVLCIGRATDVTRNPFVLGDAVAPQVIPLAVNSDMKTGAAFYARNFTSVNPHCPSSMGCAMIDVYNLT